MSFMHHIEKCNAHDLSDFLPFKTRHGIALGWIHQDRLVLLSPFKEVFEVKSDQVLLKPDRPSVRTEAMDHVCRRLHDQGHLKHWRDEPYKVSETFQEPAQFILDRCAISFFGIKAYGVHLNGFVRSKKSLKMWIARRASDRFIAPDKLDNMVAGGQPADLGLLENVIKECGEEAGIPENLARLARPVGHISYKMHSEGGVKPDVMFVYDLEIPADFIPQNTDGEVAGFELMDIDDVAEIVRTTDDFKFNCNLVIIDFLIRHGILDPDQSPDYEALQRGLRP